MGDQQFCTKRALFVEEIIQPGRDAVKDFDFKTAQIVTRDLKIY